MTILTFFYCVIRLVFNVLYFIFIAGVYLLGFVVCLGFLVQLFGKWLEPAADRFLDSMMKNSPHLAPVSAESILTKLRSRRLRGVVLAKADYSPAPAQSERIFVYSRFGSRLWKVADEWLAPDEYSRLCAELKNRCAVCEGASDAMYRTRPKYIWAGEDDDLLLWRRRCLIGRFNPREIKLRRGALPLWRAIPTTSVARARARLSVGWTVRALDLQLNRGRAVVIARKISLWSFVDITSDQFDLWGETFWLVKLTKAIAENAGIPFELHKDL